MPPHAHHGAHAHDAHAHDAGLADLLDLDAEVLGPYLDDVTGWVGQQVRTAPRRILDIGAGTGTGSIALARQFETAEVVALDRSASMLERVRQAAAAADLAERVRVVQADLDDAWPAVSGVDLAWAASFLHEVADPDRVLGDVRSALRTGGMLVVVEMDAPPRFLADSAGPGQPGLESRCHAATAAAGWNAHPDWQPHLEQAGFEIAGRRTFTIDRSPAPPSTGRYARSYLGRVRAALADRLSADDLDALDRLLEVDHPDGLLQRRDLTVRGSRTAWAARRP